MFCFYVTFEWNKFFYPVHIVCICLNSPQLASAVVSPLLTQSALDMLHRKLPPSETETWKQLGANWFLTVYVHKSTLSESISEVVSTIICCSSYVVSIIACTPC